MTLTPTPEERAAGALTPENLHRALRTFRDLGFVVLEGLYDTDFLDQVRADYDLLLDQHINEKMGGYAALEGKTFGRNHVGFFPPLLGPLADARLAGHPLAIQLAEKLLGEDFVCSFYHTNTALPGSGIQPIHRDTGPLFGTELSVPTPSTFLVVNVPLCDFTLANGSTEVWPGTHLIVDTDPADGRALEERVAGLPSVRTNIPAGSLVLRDMRMWHRGMPNDSDAPRTMMAIVWQRAWLAAKPTTIPRTTFTSWPERVQKIYRGNTVVDDAEHRPNVW